MENYRFKVVAKLKENLTVEEKKNAEDKILFLKDRLNLKEIEDCTYIVKVNDNTAFAKAHLFFLELKDRKSYFSKLEYYDNFREKIQIGA